MSISGKPKEQCLQALRAAFGNPDRAFEFLMAGLPAGGGEGEAAAEDDYGDEEKERGGEAKKGGLRKGVKV